MIRWVKSLNIPSSESNIIMEKKENYIYGKEI